MLILEIPSQQGSLIVSIRLYVCVRRFSSEKFYTKKLYVLFCVILCLSLICATRGGKRVYNRFIALTKIM